ncbi:MAG: DUF885 family protein [Erysipelotrichaceae bacterium]
MKKIINLGLILALLVCLFGCNSQPVVETDDSQFKALIDKWFIEDLQSDYTTTHFSLVNPEKYGIKDVEVSFGEIEEDCEIYRQRLAQLEEVDTSVLSSAYYITYLSLKEYYTLLDKMDRFEDDYSFLFTPNSGVNNNLITILTEFEIRSEQDCQDFVILIENGADYIDDCIDYTLEQSENGIIQNDEVIYKIIDSCQRFASHIDDNEVIKAFCNQVDEKGYDSSYKKLVSVAVIEKLIPAYNRVIEMYQGLLTKAVNQDGLSYYPNGQQYYELIFEYYSGSSLSVDSWESKLESEINKLVKKIVSIESGLSSSEQEEFYYLSYGFDQPEDDIEFMKEKMVDDFPAYYQADYIVSFLDESVASENVSAYYLLAPLDNLSENVIRSNKTYGLNDPSGLAITLAHEGYPGHLYQHTYYFSNYPDQMIRNNLDFIAYSEGWAMYVEEYAYDYYISNPNVNDLSKYYNRFNYYLYAYCDILINYEGYQLDDLINYLSLYFYSDYAELIAQDIYYTVIGDPCMFVPYALGLYQMLQLQTEAETQLGSKYSDKEFNQVILDCGSTSYDILSQQVEKYIKEKK